MSYPYLNSTTESMGRLWLDSGSFVNNSNPHQLYQSSSASGFYSVSDSGSVVPTPQTIAGSYPYGPIYPNVAAYNASIPGKVDLVFGYRPFAEF